MAPLPVLAVCRWAVALVEWVAAWVRFLLVLVECQWAAVWVVQVAVRCGEVPHLLASRALMIG